MFNIGMGELLLILLIVLVLFGAGKLPEVGGALGKGIKSFKEALQGTKDPANEENKDEEGKAD